MDVTKYLEPELADPRTLQPGDQIACFDVGRGPMLAVGIPCDEHCDLSWFALANTPGETSTVHGRPIQAGSIALHLAQVGWKIMPVPQIYARRRII